MPDRKESRCFSFFDHSRCSAKGLAKTRTGWRMKVTIRRFALTAGAVRGSDRGRWVLHLWGRGSQFAVIQDCFPAIAHSPPTTIVLRCLRSAPDIPALTTKRTRVYHWAKVLAVFDQISHAYSASSPIVWADAIMHAAIGTAVTSVPEPKATGRNPPSSAWAKNRWPIRFGQIVAELSTPVPIRFAYLGRAGNLDKMAFAIPIRPCAFTGQASLPHAFNRGFSCILIPLPVPSRNCAR